MINRIFLLFLILISLTFFALAQENDKKTQEKQAVEAVKKWFENPSFDSTNNFDLSIMNQFKDSGRYEHGLKEGSWILYTIDTSEIGKQVDLTVGTKSFKKKFNPPIEKHVGAFANGKMNGKWIKYVTFETKLPVSWMRLAETNYADGVKHGTEINYQAGGTDTLTIGNYEKGIASGKFKVYNYNDPYLLKEVDKAIGGQFVIQKKYYDNGKLEIQYTDTVLNGKRFFYFLEYHENGALKSTGYFHNNSIDSTYRAYYDNGQLSLEEVFTEGILWNVHAIYAKDGKSKKIGDFRNGTGLIYIYDENGNNSDTLKYIDGVKQNKK